MKKIGKYILFYTLYIIFLFLCYKGYLTQAYGYYGFQDNMTIASLVISSIIFIITFIYICKVKTTSYSKLITYVLILINFIPSIVTFCFMPFSYTYLLYLVIYWTMIILFSELLNKVHIKSNIKLLKTSMLNVYLVVFIELIVVLIVLFKYTGINLDFSNVYELRNNYFATRIPILLLYLFAAFKVINPLIFIYLYNQKKRSMCLLSLLVQVGAFLSDGSKSTLFSIILAYIIVKFFNNKKNEDLFANEKIKYYIIFGLFLINFTGFIEYYVFDSSLLYNYFIRRLFFIPSLLNQCYYDYFSIHTIDLFKQSILGKLGFESTYTTQIQKIISTVYFSSPNMLANNGLFSDAYMNLGKLGIFVMPFLVVLAFRLLDFCSKNINPFYLITVIISVSYIFLSSSFFTVLLTHGYLLLCIIMLYVIPRDVKVNQNE